MVQKMQIAEESEIETEIVDVVEQPVGMISTGKAQLDKKSLDLIFAVEQMIQARQHAETNIHELQDRLTHTNGHVERLNRDIKNLSKVIEEREKNVMELEKKLIEKNLKVDQVLEDYRELQASLSTEIDELKNNIDLEQQKYVNLVQKHNEAHAEKLKKMNELEEKMGRLETENAHLKQKYDTVRQEKTYLSNMISDFTNRMSIPFGNTSNERKEGNGDA
ncbi:hypothetical protein [Paenibacillus sp. GCM10012306]|uniref:hypothetical protein n=1 Tax=Paenibacillus sp. GCM10012306 TaxID=3317342 RepID=UPI00360F8248